MDQDKNEPVSFFVASKVLGVNQYAGSPELVLISIAYTQRPPDDLIEKLGALLEANVNSAKRREDRILVTPDAMRKIGILQKETVIFIQGVPRRCILRDLSFSGCKVILVGIAPFLIDKEIILRIDFDEPRIAVGVKGKIVRTEDVENRKDLVALAIQYNEADVPMAYKMHINNYLSATRKTQMGETDDEPAEKGHAAKAKPGAPSAAPTSAAAKPANGKEGEEKAEAVADGVKPETPVAAEAAKPETEAAAKNPLTVLRAAFSQGTPEGFSR